jgi:polypeptide N-acetylgalactosaminyltransferase
MVASDKVNMDRVPADLRMEECKRWDYPEKLPAVSVILVFHNEGFSTLLRTVHSIINYSPPEMIHEVVMLDDGSTREYITNGTIDRYIERWDGLVKIFHNEKREGLIRARTIGGKHSTGSVLVFLDAHCEVEPNWLPPLVAPIAKNYKVSWVYKADLRY